MLADHADAPLPWGSVISKELEVVGSHGMAAADYPELLGMVADGRLDVARLIGRVVTLDEAPRSSRRWTAWCPRQQGSWWRRSADPPRDRTGIPPPHRRLGTCAVVGEGRPTARG